jgi:hypothetical protein
MPRIPDSVIFGHNTTHDVINYGQVRAVTNDSELIQLLKIRLETFLINQVAPLQTSRSAFPLTVMTCVGIETLGEIFITEDKSDTSHQFVSISSKVNQIFGRPLQKKYQKQLALVWDNRDLKKVDCYGKVLYRFFRNTMIHGYQAKGTFLSYNVEGIEIHNDTSFIHINPDWFWNGFKAAFTKLFVDAMKAEPTNLLRMNCLDYIKSNLLE